MIKELSGKDRYSILDEDAKLPPHKLFELLAKFNIAVARGEKPEVALFWQIWKIRNLDRNATKDDL